MFTFANPWLFWFFPVLALPWIFRRRQEERIQHINFPLIQFLRESEEKELINPQLQELLLLILRTLLLALLLVSLAGPKWVSQGTAKDGLLSMFSVGRAFQNHWIVMDSSYSMGYGEGEQSWWQEAERTWKFVDRGWGGFSSQLLRWDRSTVGHAMKNLSQKNPLLPLSAVERESLFATRPTEEGTSVLDLFEDLRQSIEGSGTIFLITDGQRLPWKPLLEGTVDPNTIPPLLVATVGSEPVTNIWCDVNTISSPPWGIAGWETIAGNVKAMLSSSLTDGTISIQRTESNETLYSHALRFPVPSSPPSPTNPSSSMSIPFDFTTQFVDLRSSGEGNRNEDLDVTVRVEPQDLLPIDNEIHVRIPIFSSFTIGLVCQNDDSGPILSILTSAINPLRGTPQSPPVTIDRLSPPNFNYAASPDLVLLCGEIVNPWFALEEVPKTMEYIKNGGSAIVVLGEKDTGNDAWQQLVETLGWHWLDTASNPGQAGSISTGGAGLYAQALSAWDKKMWETWIPKQHGRVEGEGILPLITYQIGGQTSYLITQIPLGKGRVWVVNSSLDPNRDTLLSPILPALIWETGKEVARSQRSGEMVIPSAREESDLTLLQPDEKKMLQERYGIRFANGSTLQEEMDSVYGGTDLRVLLLLLCILLALGESWLANKLASL